MSSDARKLLQEALRLPGSERLRLAELLLATCDGDPDPDAAEAWEEEIARRSRDIEEGLVEPIPWPDVKGTARKARGAS
jgi:putative addiction module component (TIGR02574 family)